MSIKDGKNIVLIAMPGAGKTTIGKILAEKLHVDFIDVDEEFYKTYGKTTADDIEEKGVEDFRTRETEIVKAISKRHNSVIATGGGAVVKAENREYLKENGIIVYIERDIDKLDVSGRPISKTGNLTELFNERREIYETFSEIQVKNDKTPSQVAERIIEILGENI